MSPATEMTAINFYVVKYAFLAWELNSKTTIFPLLSNDIKIFYTKTSSYLKTMIHEVCKQFFLFRLYMCWKYFSSILRVRISQRVAVKYIMTINNNKKKTEI